MRVSHLLPSLIFLQLIGRVTSFFQQHNAKKLSPEELWMRGAPNKVDRSTAWNAKYQQLAQVYQQQGHLSNVRSESPTLYRWMVNQRNKRAGKGNHAPLTESQIQLLDQLEFPWAPRNDWNDMYQELVEFYSQHGHLRVQYKSPLYVWMETQRRKWAGRKGYAPLTKEQIQRLDEIHFCWNPAQDEQERQQEAWYDNYQKLGAFYEQHGHWKVPSGSNLYTWMVYQRVKKRAIIGGAGGNQHGKYAPLTEEQIRLLDEMNFPWGPNKGGTHELAWNQKYQELVDFKKEHGHLQVTRPSSLYTWMVNQRQRRAGKGDCVPLSEEQIQWLDKIDFPWVPLRAASRHEQAWHAKYQELANFYQQHGHLQVPRPSSLYTWMNNQRSKWRNTMCHNNEEGRRRRRPTLTQEQIQLLDQLQFPWEPRQQQRHQHERKEDEEINDHQQSKGKDEKTLELVV